MGVPVPQMAKEGDKLQPELSVALFEGVEMQAPPLPDLAGGEGALLPAEEFSRFPGPETPGLRKLPAARLAGIGQLLSLPEQA